MSELNPKRAPKRSQAGHAIASRIRELGMSQQVLANELGRKQAWVSMYLLNDTAQTVRRMLVEDPRLFGVLLATLGWSSKKFFDETGLESELAFFAIERDVDELALKHARGIEARGRMLRVKSSATAGLPQHNPMEIWVEFRYDRPQAFAFLIEGDSMLPTLKHGDVVLADGALKRLVHGKMFVVNMDGDYSAKRARLVGKNWVLTSDNPDYPDWPEVECEVVGIIYYVQPPGRSV